MRHRPAVHTIGTTRCDAASIGAATSDHGHAETRPSSAIRTTAHLSFPVVGIGASAGGFGALAALLRQLPASPGMALVVILHLPGDQQSNADRVLQRTTRLPVVQVNHPAPILPDHVYVIPPACG